MSERGRNPVLKALGFLRRRLWWTVCGLAVIILIDLAIYLWMRVAPESVPLPAHMMLFASISGAPLLVVGLFVENLLTRSSRPERDGDAVSDAAEQALTERLREELGRKPRH
tara:strand:+ start:174 stop:509 length:336 start_codon:yes stop_codon:yes gene_type:complete